MAVYTLSSLNQSFSIDSEVVGEGLITSLPANRRIVVQYDNDINKFTVAVRTTVNMPSYSSIVDGQMQAVIYYYNASKTLVKTGDIGTANYYCRNSGTYTATLYDETRTLEKYAYIRMNIYISTAFPIADRTVWTDYIPITEHARYKASAYITVFSNPSYTSSTLSWTSDVALKSMSAKIGNTTLYNRTFTSATKSGTVSVPNLVPNKTYTVVFTGTRYNHTVTTTKSMTTSTERLPSISSAVNFNVGNNLTLTLSKAVPLATKLRVTVGSNNYDVNIAANATSATFNASNYNDIFYASSPNKKTLDVSAYVYYTGTNYANESETGKGTTKTGKATIVNSNPTFSSFILQNTDSVTTTLLGKSDRMPYGFGTLSAIIPVTNKAVGANYATIAKYVCQIMNGSTVLYTANIQYSSTADVKGILGNLSNVLSPSSSVRTITVSIYAVDSRGYNSSPATNTITILPYYKPSINFKNIQRVNGFEQEIEWDIESFYSKLMVDGVQKNNSYNIKLNVYLDGALVSEYSNIALTDLISSSYSDDVMRVSNVKTEADTLFVLNRDNNYTIEFVCTDKLSTAKYEVDIPAGISILGIHDNKMVSVAVNPDLESDCALQVGSDILASDRHILGEIDALGTRIASVGSDINTQISNVNTTLDGRITTVNNNLSSRISTNATGISTLNSVVNKFDTYTPILPEDDVLPNPLYISTSPTSPYLQKYRIGQNASGEQFSNMPVALRGLTCVLFRTVLFATENHILVKMEEAYPALGRIWYNFYNFGTWTGWKCVSPL